MLPGRARLCVLSKLLHPTASQPTTTPATSAARDADYLLDDNYLFGQNMTEHNPAPSPSGHPLLSGPPTLTDIHQIFTLRTDGGDACAPTAVDACAAALVVEAIVTVRYRTRPAKSIGWAG